MRSMLALGASNLALTTASSAELANKAIAHRVEAVKLLNKALSRPATCREEADARFAAFMSKFGEQILDYQRVSHLDDFFFLMPQY